MNTANLKPQTAETLSDKELKLASRSRRLGATCVDILILVFVTFWVTLASDLLSGPEPYMSEYGVQLRVLFVGIVVYLVLNGYLLFTRGQTLGKLLFRIAIVASGTGELPAWWQLTLRALCNVCFYGVIGSYLAWLIFIDHVAIFFKQRKCLHDWVLKTDVVQLHKQPS